MEKNQIKATIIVKYRIVYSALNFMFDHLRYYLILNIHFVD
jgi:hypothetical protein